MAGKFTNVQTWAFPGSGSYYFYFPIYNGPYTSVQISKSGSLTTTAIRLETSNWSIGPNDINGDPYSGSTESWRWQEEVDFTTQYSGSLFTGSANGAWPPAAEKASKMMHIGNNGAKWGRLFVQAGYSGTLHFLPGTKT